MVIPNNHPASNFTGYSYGQAAVAHNLHNLQHVNHQLEPVSNRFEIPSNYNSITLNNATPYVQSIQMFFILTFTIIIFIILAKFCIVTIYSCVENVRQEDEDEDRPINRPVYYCRLCLLLFALIGALGALAYAVAVGNSVNLIFVHIGSYVSTSANKTATYANVISSDLNTMKISFQQLNQTNNSAYRTVSLLDVQLPANSSILEEGEKIWTTIQNGISKAGTFLRAAVIGVAAGAASLALLGWIAALVDECLCRGKQRCTSCGDGCCCIFIRSFTRLLFELFFLILSVVLAVLVSLVFAGSVAVSDACASFDSTLVTAVNTTNGGNSSQIVQYYVYCNTAKYGDPYANVTSAKMELNGGLTKQVNQTVVTAKSIYPVNSTQYLAATNLNSSYYSLVSNVDGLVRAISCTNFISPLQSTKTTICSLVVANLFGFCFMLGAFLLFLNIRECTTCCYYAKEDDDRDPYRNSELSPLV